MFSRLEHMYYFVKFIAEKMLKCTYNSQKYNKINLIHESCW
jgi:hypothetical protein